MNARELATIHKISERTARRHIRRGTTPAGERRIGRDGKTYPAATSYRSPLHAPLAQARSHIRRALRAEEFYDGDLALVQHIATEAQALLDAWTRAIECHVTPGDRPPRIERNVTTKGTAQ